MSPDLVAAAVALALSAIGIWALRRAAASLPPDRPNARSLHANPVPRAGGYAVWLGFLPVAMLYPPSFPMGLAGWLPPWLALALISGLDDRREVGVGVRLTMHALAALWAAVALAPGPLEWPALPAVTATLAVALVIAWSSNLYNFMDGTDGLAGTMAAIGFGAYGLAATVRVPAGSAPAFFGLAAAILPFLAVNKPRATMFLGDVGAVPLGFLAAAFGIAGILDRTWPAWFPALVFLPFIADSTWTLARRIARRERLSEGHRGHYYQRLAQLGFGHRGTLAVYGGLMAGTSVTALVCRLAAPAAGWWALCAWCAVVFMLYASIDYHWQRRKDASIPR